MEALSENAIGTIRQAAAKKGLRTDRQIAEILGISYQSFSRRINGHINFTVSEIRCLHDKLGLTKGQVYSIFFGDPIEKKS